MRARPEGWPAALAGLARLDWSRANTALWEGRALHGGRVVKSGAAVTLTASTSKVHRGLELGPEEIHMEQRRRA